MEFFAGLFRPPRGDLWPKINFFEIKKCVDRIDSRANPREFTQLPQRKILKIKKSRQPNSLMRDDLLPLPHAAVPGNGLPQDSRQI